MHIRRIILFEKKMFIKADFILKQRDFAK